MSDILAKIEAYKREEIAAAKRARPLAALEKDAKAAAPPRGFLRAIEKRIFGDSYALILGFARIWRSRRRQCPENSSASNARARKRCFRDEIARRAPEASRA